MPGAYLEVVSAAWAERSPPERVLVYGSGVPALEAVLVLADHADDLYEVELISPSRDFAVRAPAPDPFGSRHGLRLDLGQLAAELGIGFRSDAVTSVDPGGHEARTRLGERLPYRALIIASGTRLREAVPGAITAWGAADRTVFSRLVPELLSGEVRSVAFCAHAADPWTLPLYELALLTATRLHAAEIEDVELSVVTWESSPVQVLGHAAGEAVAAVLEEAGIEMIADREPIGFEPGLLRTAGDPIAVERAVALPRHDGSYIANVPLDAAGFIPTDGYGRVEDTEGLYAAGEVTATAIRHAAIAAEQARASAEAVAADAGAPIEPRAAGSVLSGTLLACPLTRESGARRGLWWPPEALSGPRLRDHLRDSVGFELPELDGGIAVELDLESLTEAQDRLVSGTRPERLH